MNEETLFMAALERPTVAERRAFLYKACAGDVALRRRVERLLAAHWETLGILDQPLSPPGSVEANPLVPGSRLSTFEHPNLRLMLVISVAVVIFLGGIAGTSFVLIRAGKAAAIRAEAERNASASPKPVPTTPPTK